MPTANRGDPEQHRKRFQMGQTPGYGVGVGKGALESRRICVEPELVRVLAQKYLKVGFYEG
jgi:hypothetical protein